MTRQSREAGGRCWTRRDHRQRDLRRCPRYASPRSAVVMFEESPLLRRANGIASAGHCRTVFRCPLRERLPRSLFSHSDNLVSNREISQEFTIKYDFSWLARTRVTLPCSLVDSTSKQTAKKLAALSGLCIGPSNRRVCADSTSPCGSRAVRQRA